MKKKPVKWPIRGYKCVDDNNFNLRYVIIISTHFDET